MLVEALLLQVAERDRVESNFATGDADELPGSKRQAAGPRKSWHEWYKELTVNLAMGGRDSDEGPDTKGNMRGRRLFVVGSTTRPACHQMNVLRTRTRTHKRRLWHPSSRHSMHEERNRSCTSV